MSKFIGWLHSEPVEWRFGIFLTLSLVAQIGLNFVAQSIVMLMGYNIPDSSALDTIA